MNIDKKTFCVAPWFQIRNKNDMSKRVCCAIETLDKDEDNRNLTPLEYLNSEHIVNLKKQLIEGKKPDACSTCWQFESNSLLSLRQYLNNHLTAGNFNQKTWLDAYFKKKKDYKTDMILMADVSIGNTCNHACIMCNPQDSSLIYNDWIKRKDSEFVKEYLKINPNYFKTVKFNGYKNKKYREYIDSVLKNNKKLKLLKILGGEPFLDNELISTLKNIDKKVKAGLQIHFVTNGSINIIPVLEYIGKFKHIKISVSIEGVGPVQEYARAGSNWEFVEQNILKTIEKNICNISIQHSLQTTTILGFESLLKWCKQHSIKINCGIVENPNYLSISALPTRLKNEIIEKINPYHSNFSNKVDLENKTLPYKDLIMLIKDIKYNPTLNKKFFEYIEWYQTNKKIPKLQTLFPELYEKYKD
jgi:hypothetical protein